MRMEKLWMWIAWHVPRTLARWVFVRVVVAGTPDSQSPTSVLAVDALRRWA